MPSQLYAGEGDSQWEIEGEKMKWNSFPVCAYGQMEKGMKGLH